MLMRTAQTISQLKSGGRLSLLLFTLFGQGILSQNFPKNPCCSHQSLVRERVGQKNIDPGQKVSKGQSLQGVPLLRVNYARLEGITREATHKIQTRREKMDNLHILSIPNIKYHQQHIV